MLASLLAPMSSVAIVSFLAGGATVALATRYLERRYVDRCARRRRTTRTTTRSDEDGDGALPSVDPKDWGLKDAPYKMLLAVNQSLLDDKGKPTKMKPGKVESRHMRMPRALSSTNRLNLHALSAVTHVWAPHKRGRSKCVQPRSRRGKSVDRQRSPSR